MSEYLWRLGEAHRMGWLHFIHEYPPRMLLVASVPRVLLQALFFVLLGGVLSGESGREWTLVGVSASIMTLFTAVAVYEVPELDIRSGTLYRYQLGPVSPIALMLSRCVPHIVAGVAAAVLTIAVLGPLTGHGDRSLRLLPLFPLYLLMAVTSTMAGLAVSMASAPVDQHIVAANLLSYSILIGSGAVVPVSALGTTGAVLHTVLPIGHGLDAVRAILAEQPWQRSLLAELVVGAAWLLLAVLVSTLRTRRARTTGIDAVL